jgi:hypothetical protein
MNEETFFLYFSEKWSRWWKDIDGKTEGLGEKPVPVPL